ncbi:hypothetical protein QBZ16_003118 [Prototheca wickerhamii]|uniref:mannan endo-1,4-beta-mannosidase n=1 Tax=Prototheca wickerhamii TaxID=3111 RepID=A0AAD9MNS0_PROWI|nr:hypothetical protein QBZ16_003118 [Prototheca wickerhamii]
MACLRSRTKEAGGLQEGLVTSASAMKLELYEEYRRGPRGLWTAALLGLGVVALFMHKCRPFYVVGFNVENLPEAVMAAPASGHGLQGAQSGKQVMRSLLQSAAFSGLNTLRFWAHTTNPSRPLQVAPGRYDEHVFASLDVALAEAERAGLRVILSLADNWKYEGGVDEMLDWSKTAPKREAAFPAVKTRSGDVNESVWTPERQAYEARRKALFFVDEGARQIYKGHVSAILNRVNTVTGRRYADDPTIMAFDLLNEPRCLEDHTPGCAARVGAWVKEMAAYLRSLDANHLVTSGADGFWGPTDPERRLNPGAALGNAWASRIGQDFAAHHASLDFATIHTWPDHWQTPNETFVAEWVRDHVRSAGERLAKPLLVEEFGKKVPAATRDAAAVAAARDPVFATVYREAERLLVADSALGGTLFWRWGFDAWDAAERGDYGVTPGDSTFEHVRAHARRVKMLTAARAGAGAAICPNEDRATAAAWVGASLLGVRRCVLRPTTVNPPGPRRSLGALEAASPSFATRAECCLPGLGAFANGCLS